MAAIDCLARMPLLAVLDLVGCHGINQPFSNHLIRPLFPSLMGVKLPQTKEHSKWLQTEVDGEMLKGRHTLSVSVNDISVVSERL